MGMVRIMQLMHVRYKTAKVATVSDETNKQTTTTEEAHARTAMERGGANNWSFLRAVAQRATTCFDSQPEIRILMQSYR